ncbi:hit finger domain-containing protein [Colletotrichum truncatum]|uniref:Hit finger domain-containing protein n=1 Tax=Colletotrichum truncatum TaxID=5467 RepID=A0ACC3Z9P8_COLTU|nr:hit finger domain-containing protein [Colletotrichum truncatum]KAF6795981.1 hit finger domain-containing protein [Colletotrichum truncatum]
MADPLLTSLCAICHIETPKYKCPRCTIRTCSLACTKRHKAWSSCNGIRDATAYVPPSKLKTPAGVDHDYNFLSSIERAVQRSEKEIVEERHLLRPEDLRPIEVRTVKWKTGRDGRKRRVLVTELLRGDNAGGGSGLKSAEMLSSLPFKKRLGKFGILLRRAPVGMARQKENGTNFSKASSRINWQVEWLLVSPPALEADTKTQQEIEKATDDPPKVETKRILAKALDDMPLYKAFVMGQKSFNDDLARREQQRLQQEDGEEPDESRDTNAGGRPKKRRKHPHKPGQSLATAQDTETGAWHPGRYCLQVSPRGTWMPQTGVPAFTGMTEEEEAQKSKYTFFLVGTTSAATAAAGQVVVHAVDATLPLGEALRDITVLEFPTIYVVEHGSPLPAFLVSEPKPVLLTQKRKRGNQPIGKKGGKGSKKLRRNMEDGELPSDGEDVSEDEDEGRLDVLNNIIAEESLGEDDDENDSTTSSSGSDSDSDEVVRASLAAKLALLKKSAP